MSGLWDIVVPIAATNMVKNPVAGAAGNVATYGVGSTLSRDQLFTYLGGWSWYVQTVITSGVTYTTRQLPNADHVVRIRVTGAYPICQWSLDTTTFHTPTQLSSEGIWDVYTYTFPASEANGHTTFIIKQTGTGSGAFYLGHAQVELAQATTPIIGSLPGCYWEGAPHGSSSVRNANERSGGIVYDLDTQYGFYVTRMIGIGNTEKKRYATDLSLLPGSIDEGYKVLSRTFSLVGEMNGSTWQNMHLLDKNLLSVLSPDYAYGDQDVRLRYRGANLNKPAAISVKLLNGMEFGEYAGFTPKHPLKFRANDPYFYDVYQTVKTLTTSRSISSSDYVTRKKNGSWAKLSSGINFNGTVRCFAKSADGYIYIGGSFLNIGDTSGDCIIKYDPVTETVSSLGSGALDSVKTIAIAPNGYVYVGGAFTQIGGVANTNRIAYWNGSTWVAMATGLNGDVESIVIGQDGTIYIAGAFTDAGAIATADYICKWTGSAFASITTGGAASAQVNELAIAPNGYLYATGSFNTINGVTVGQVAYWDGTTWYSMGGGLSGGSDIGYAIAIDASGRVYVGGDFTTAGGVSCLNIAMWNGQIWSPLGSGCSGGIVMTMVFGPDGRLHAAGTFTAAGGLSLADPIAAWNEDNWAHEDVNLPVVLTVYSLFFDRDVFYIGFANTGAFTSSEITQVEYTGTGRTYPELHLIRSGGTSAIVKWLKSQNTGATIYLNYSLLDGEELTIKFNPQGQECISSFFGSVWRALIRGSDSSEFYLIPGFNNIESFVDAAGSPTITSFLLWQNAYESADGTAA